MSLKENFSSIPSTQIIHPSFSNETNSDNLTIKSLPSPSVAPLSHTPSTSLSPFKAGINMDKLDKPADSHFPSFQNEAQIDSRRLQMTTSPSEKEPKKHAPSQTSDFNRVRLICSKVDVFFKMHVEYLMNPDTMTPFSSMDDAIRRLLPYHLLVTKPTISDSADSELNTLKTLEKANRRLHSADEGQHFFLSFLNSKCMVESSKLITTRVLKKLPTSAATSPTISTRPPEYPSFSSGYSGSSQGMGIYNQQQNFSYHPSITPSSSTPIPGSLSFVPSVPLNSITYTVPPIIQNYPNFYIPQRQHFPSGSGTSQLLSQHPNLSQFPFFQAPVGSSSIPFYNQTTSFYPPTYNPGMLKAHAEIKRPPAADSTSSYPQFRPI